MTVIMEVNNGIFATFTSSQTKQGVGQTIVDELVLKSQPEHYEQIQDLQQKYYRVPSAMICVVISFRKGLEFK